MPDCFDGVDRNVPLALLPVRLQARFKGQMLQVRVLPDQIHANAHSKQLTALECSAGQEYLAAHLETARYGPVAQPKRNRTNGSYVRGDVLASYSIPAGGSANENAVLVGEGHAQPVDFQLGDIRDGVCGSCIDA